MLTHKEIQPGQHYLMADHDQIFVVRSVVDGKVNYAPSDNENHPVMTMSIAAFAAVFKILEDKGQGA